MNRKIQSFICMGMTAMLSISLLGVPSAAENITGDNLPTGNMINSVSDHDYSNYLSENANLKSGTEDVQFLFDTIKASIKIKDSENVTFTGEFAEGGLYNLSLSYKVLDGKSDINICIKIDGSYPFDGAKDISLPAAWKDGSDIRKDDFGNEFSPEQVLYGDYRAASLADSTGAQTYPYKFAFSAGKHTLELEVISGEIELNGMSAIAPDDGSITYGEYISKNSSFKNYSGESIVIEGEDANIKAERSIISKADSSSKKLTPSNVAVSKINYIGGTNWKNSGEEIVWRINVPEDGLYKLGIMYKQDQVINGYSYRNLKIDGYTPFEEAGHIAFPYNTDWKFYEFSDKADNPYLFSLTAGEHELSLSVTLGQTAEFYSRLKDYTQRIGNLYIDIIMITGESPDTNRDYELFRQIPDYDSTLKSLYEGLENLAKDVETLNGSRGGNYVAAIRNMSRVIKQMLDNSYTAQLYVKDYYTNYTTLSSWLYEMTVMPLSIDQIRLAALDKSFGEKKVNVFEGIGFSVMRFFASFSKAYNDVSDVKNDKNTIKIWVNWGRDQAQVLNSLIQESFTAKTGINVNLEVVNADLIKGMLSSNQPDLALHMSRATPVNLAMRGALYDLSNFSDYKETASQFGKSATVPYEYGDGVYALPDQQSFYLMFYRKDILDELGIAVPETWEEFMAATAVLQRNNMNSYIPYTKITSATTTDTGIGGLNLYATILMQSGGKFYNSEKNKSLLTGTTALSAFKYWTDMYTQYKLPTEADFYNRFKVGTCPLGVSIYTQYNTFLQAAPEIRGRWGIALVPGMKDENGNVNRTVSGAGTGCAILNKSDKKELAWEFLKWWSSADTQVRYSADVESVLGAVSRVPTANIEAFSRMGWDKNDLSVLVEQQSYIEEIPEIPGSYYLSRSVDQAYWTVINGKSSVKDALTKWGKEADKEIARKISEYEGA